jgi:hypothetical protein
MPANFWSRFLSISAAVVEVCETKLGEEVRRRRSVYADWLCESAGSDVRWSNDRGEARK